MIAERANTGKFFFSFFAFAELIEHALTNQNKDTVKSNQSGAETWVGFGAFSRAIRLFPVVCFHLSTASLPLSLH